MFSVNNKYIAVELLPLYKKQGFKKGRWDGISRKEHYFQLAKSLRVTRKFVKALFQKEEDEGVYVDVGTKIRTKAGLNRPRKTRVSKSRKINKTPARKQVCSSQSHILCLKVFITNTEDTACLRCK